METIEVYRLCREHMVHNMVYFLPYFLRAMMVSVKYITHIIDTFFGREIFYSASDSNMIPFVMTR